MKLPDIRTVNRKICATNVTVTSFLQAPFGAKISAVCVVRTKHGKTLSHYSNESFASNLTYGVEGKVSNYNIKLKPKRGHEFWTY